MRRDVNALTNSIAVERRARLELTELVRTLSATLHTVIAKTGIKMLVPAAVTNAASNASGSGSGGGSGGGGSPLSISEALYPNGMTAAATNGSGSGDAAGVSSGGGGGGGGGGGVLYPLSPHQQQRTRTVFPSPLKKSPLKQGGGSGSGSGSGGGGGGGGNSKNSEFLPATADPSLAAQLEYISHAPLTAPIHISERKSMNRKQPEIDPRVKYAPPRPVPTASNKPGSGGRGVGGVDGHDSDADSELELAVTTDEAVVRTLTGDLVATWYVPPTAHHQLTSSLTVLCCCPLYICMYVSRRCGERFNTNRTGNYDCAFHSGRLHKSTNRYECCGVIAPLTVMEKSDRPIYCKFGPHIS